MTDAKQSERVAEAIWQAESLRATGRTRRVPWSDCNQKTRDQYLHLADAAIAAIKEDQK